VELNFRERVLETAGHQVLTARFGEDDIEQFRSEDFDLVLLDYWMPGMNGIATVRELR
jgi:DNA-binding response OmpR family regulator